MSTCPANPAPDPLPKKPAVPFDAEKIPASLKVERRWVCWNYAIREGKPTKAPINARTGRGASSTSPRTWSTFDEAVSSFRTHGYAGVGYVLGDGWAGVDVDQCIDEKGAIAPAAQEIIAELATYSEISPSGAGIKMIMLGTKPPKVKCKASNVPGCKAVEVYGHDRFFTTTGRQLEGTPSSVEPRQEALDALRAKLFPPKQKPPPPPPASGTAPAAGFPGTDDELIEKAGKAKNRDKFSRLWAGEISQYQDDESAAGGVRDGVKRPKGSVTIVPVATATLRERISKYTALLKFNKQGEVTPAHPTGWLVGGVEARGWWPNLRRLSGVSDVPVLRPDGTVWQTEG